MTTMEYLQTPETVLPRELAFGVMRVADSPVVRHQRVVRDLTIALTAFARERRLGEVLPAPMDVILDRENDLVVQPDLLFVSSDRDDIVGDKIFGAPDLVVEVLSPHPRIGKLDERVEWFARYGVRECWLIEIVRREMVVLTFDGGRVATRALAAPDAPVPSVVLAGFPTSPVGLFGWQWRH
jgi:Uma2 family endonuclease